MHVTSYNLLNFAFIEHYLLDKTAFYIELSPTISLKLLQLAHNNIL